MLDYSVPNYVEERPIGHRVTGVFVFCFIPSDDWGVPLWRFMFFRSTMKASAYLGFRADVVKQELKRTRNTTMDGMAIIHGSVLFMTPRKLRSHESSVSRHWVERLFPWLAEPKTTAEPSLQATDETAAPASPPVPLTPAKRRPPPRAAAAYDAFAFRALLELTRMSRSARRK